MISEIRTGIPIKRYYYLTLFKGPANKMREKSPINIVKLEERNNHYLQLGLYLENLTLKIYCY